MLVACALEFARRYPCMPDPDGFLEPPIDDALLEATLVHLRLLDDFLAGSSHPNAVNARAWIPDWSERCIPKEVRERIDAQVVHLSSRRLRMPSPRWDIPAYAHACCERLDKFFEAVRVQNPERSPAFDGARDQISRGLSLLRRRRSPSRGR